MLRSILIESQVHSTELNVPQLYEQKKTSLHFQC